MPDAIALMKGHWVAFAGLLVLVALLVSARVRQSALTLMRILANPLLLLAAVALVYDGTRTLTGPDFVVTSLAEHWQSLAPTSLETARSLVARRIAPALWDPVITSALRLPTWLALGALGLGFAYLGRKRRTVNVFAN